ncbi:MAG TPA: hypothetical protein VIF82_08555 [Burkholderiaceae bacterium]
MSKQLFYLNNNNLTAYTWAKGGLSVVREFQNDIFGQEEFSTYLAANSKVVAYVLVDLIEESFQRDTMPHVTGNARRTLIRRRIGQIYRDTPFRQGMIQGREKTGRKDDHVLFSALTNPSLVKPWVDALIEKNVPLAGIFSLPLLSTVLFKKFKLDSGPLLLVTHQSSGLRQSYLQGGSLIFSRITPLSNMDPGAIAESVTQELAKTRQFLASTRQLPIGAMINIAIIANDDNLDALKTVCEDTSSVLYRFIAFDEAAHILGLKSMAGMSICDPLFLSVLGNNAPERHYALLEQERFYKLWQTRTAIYGLSAATLIGGIIWAGMTGIAILDAQIKNSELNENIHLTENQYAALIRSMPNTVTKPQNMKDTVDIEKMISQNTPEPASLFGIVSQALSGLPEIRINQMQWQLSETAPVSGATEPPPVLKTAVETAPPMGLIGIPKQPYQILIIEGAIDPFQNDYRSALDSVNRFTIALTKNKQLQVEVKKAPLDIRPTVTLNGKEGIDDDKAKANFIMKLIWTP